MNTVITNGFDEAKMMRQEFYIYALHAQARTLPLCLTAVFFPIMMRRMMAGSIEVEPGELSPWRSAGPGLNQ